mgnify:CR=1 FL=1
MKARLAFYIASNGNWIDKTIAWYTNSKYSHVELVVGEYWYSTSPRDLQVRKKKIVPTEGRWDFIEVDTDLDYIINFYSSTEGMKYDWLGIFLSQFIPLGIQSERRWFCSEWCASALKLTESSQYSPQGLYLYLTSLK